MTIELGDLSPPHTGLYRLSWRSSPVFAPPAWDYADPEDGTFNNRFDDPGLTAGIRTERRFRMIYCSTERICTLMESCARFRVSLPDHVFPDDSRGDAGSRRGHGAIPAEWRLEHVIGHTLLDPSLRFVDIAAMSTMSHLREAMAADLLELGLRDLDLSVVTGPQRVLTQRIARYIYEQVDSEGRQRIRYLSRLGDNQECWAIFDTRLVTRGTVIEQVILPHDPDLLAVAHAFGLTIEVLDGHDLRP